MNVEIERHCHLILIDQHIGYLEHCRKILFEIDCGTVCTGEGNHRQVSKLLHFMKITPGGRFGYSPALRQFCISYKGIAGAVTHIDHRT